MLRLIPDVDTGRRIRASSIFKAFGEVLPDELIAAEIERLVRDRFVKRCGRKSLQKVNGWAPLHRRIVAVELKLSRVTEALLQAKDHLAFADESYIGLPADLAARIQKAPDRWNRYWELGVGLLAVTKTKCRVVRASKPPSASRDEALQMYVTDKFWRQRSEAIHH